MVLPRREGKPSILPKIIKNSLNIQPKEVYKSRDYLLVISIVFSNNSSEYGL